MTASYMWAQDNTVYIDVDGFEVHLTNCWAIARFLRDIDELKGLMTDYLVWSSKFEALLTKYHRLSPDLNICDDEVDSVLEDRIVVDAPNVYEVMTDEGKLEWLAIHLEHLKNKGDIEALLELAKAASCAALKAARGENTTPKKKVKRVKF